MKKTYSKWITFKRAYESNENDKFGTRLKKKKNKEIKRGERKGRKEKEGEVREKTRVSMMWD